jgi:hypothetical protein
MSFAKPVMLEVCVLRVYDYRMETVVNQSGGPAIVVCKSPGGTRYKMTETKSTGPV